MAMTKVKNLQLWCKKMADGYRDVEVKDMAASWKSGLAFCAIIHKFRPDLIDYDSLSKENVFDNNQLAFEVAERELSIPAFLEADDMVAIRVPDRLSVVTYVSQYYNYFHDKPQLGGPGINKFVSHGNKKKEATTDKSSLSTVNKNVADTKKKDRQETLGDKCNLCHEKVYLLERLIENKKLYHRSCHRKTEQSPTSKVFKRQQTGPREPDSLETSKLRKLDETPKNGSGDKGSTPDFWQRRAQAKAQDSPVVNKVTPDKGKDMSSVSSSDRTNVNVPSWSKRTEDRPESGLVKPSSKDSADMFNKPALKQTSGAPKPGNIVNKFKELEERNKQQSGGATSSTNKDSSGLSVPKVVSTSSPVPKPRQNKFEKMDVDVHDPHPKAAPRALNSKDKNVSPRASPRNFETKNNSPQLKTKHEFSRPKTPPSSAKSNFSITLSTTATHESPDISPGSPPPLPVGSPPKLPQSEPPKLSTTTELKKAEIKSKVISKGVESKGSPMSSPREETKFGKKLLSSSNATTKETFAPAKPHRSSTAMDTSETLEPAKAVVHEPKTEHKAVLVVPKRPQNEKKNREVVGGLLKSLAVVRTKHDQDAKSTSSSAEYMKSAHRSSDINTTHNVAEKDNEKSKASDKKDTKFKVPARPKSSFISQSTSLFSDPAAPKEVKSNVATKTTTTTVTTVDKGKGKKTETVVTETVTNKTKDKNENDIPEWKKNLLNKPRPKSADLLSERTNEKPAWQIEAENRKNARKGGYIDPEKAKIDISQKFTKPNSTENLNGKSANGFDKSKALSPPRMKDDSADKYVPPATKKRIEPEPFGKSKNAEKEDKSAEKKKIGLSERFVFEDIEVASKPKKPPRLEIKAAEASGPKSSPARPPPPSPSAALSGNSKHHLTAYQIQRQLQLIDDKLTKLELKGRQLEDQIRTAEESTEDELMISWFKLVNDKNELVRKECDYIYISRQQELELEQQDTETRLRQLIEKPEMQKTERELKEEEELMMKKVDLVNQRNSIVESIDEDRLRYLEEDRDIEYLLQQKAFKETKVKKKGMRLGFSKDKTGGMKKDKKAKKEKK